MKSPLKVGAKGIDFAFAPDSIEGIKKNGALFICRYSAGTASNGNSKCTKVGEIQAAERLGVDFFGNFELTESTPTEGKASGKRHGLADKDFWHSRNLATKAGIIVSWEPGSDKSKFKAVALFLEGYKNGVDRPIGMYAGLQTLLHFRKLGLIDVTWLPMSTAASGLPNVPDSQKPALLEKAARDNGINLCQNFKRWYGMGADEDVMITMPKIPFSHMQAIDAAKPTPTPKPKPDPKPQPKPPTKLPANAANRLMSPDQKYEVRITNGGKLALRKDGKHVRYLDV